MKIAMHLFAFGLPSAVLFGGVTWGIVYFFMLRKIQIRNWVFYIHLVGYIVLMAFINGAMFYGELFGRPNKDIDLPKYLAFAIILAIASCSIVRWQEKNFRESKEHSSNEEEASP